MKTKFTVSNFRAFDESGASFELAPITILTGCNSSGKSSMVKALMLLTDCLTKISSEVEINNDFRLEDCCIDFSSIKHRSMGRFDKVLNRNADKNRAITFAYTINSEYLADHVTAELSFVAQESDELNRGWLSSICIKNSLGEVMLSAAVNENNRFEINKINLACIKSNFINFGLYSCGLNIIDSLQITQLAGEEYAEADEETLNCTLEKIKLYIDKSSISEAAKKGYRDLFYNKKKSISSISGNELWKSLEASVENNTILYIPLIGKLKNLSKKEAIKYIQNLVSKENVGVILKLYVERIIEDYSASEYESFADYYIAKEESEGYIFENVKLTHSIFDSLSFKSQQVYLAKWKDTFLNYISAATSIKTNPKTLIDIDRLRLETPSIAIYGDNGLLNSEELKLENNEREEQLAKSPISENVENAIKELAFQDIYGVLIELDVLDNNDHSDYITKSKVQLYYTEGYSAEHKLSELYRKYFQAILLEVLSPEQFIDTKYVGSNRINIQRLYSFDDLNSDFSRLLRRYFDAKRTHKNAYIPNSFTNSWLKKFGIGESIEIKFTEEGLGATIYIVNPDGNKVLLADEGYGISQLVSVILEIETAILEGTVSEYRKDGVYKSYLEEEDKYFQYHKSTIVIEEPEVHLHPRYQSMLADMFVEAYKEYNIYCIVETHSEYLIRRMQNLVALQGVDTNDVSLEYVNSDLQAPKVRHIEIQTNGRLSSPFGSGFLDEADNLAMNLLTIKINH